MPAVIIALCALFAPRLVIILIWLFTPWIENAYSSILWPLVGLIFMPFTTLAYMATMLNNHHQVSGLWVALIVVAVLVDLGTPTSARRLQ